METNLAVAELSLVEIVRNIVGVLEYSTVEVVGVADSRALLAEVQVEDNTAMEADGDALKSKEVDMILRQSE